MTRLLVAMSLPVLFLGVAPYTWPLTEYGRR